MKSSSSDSLKTDQIKMNNHFLRVLYPALFAIAFLSQNGCEDSSPSHKVSNANAAGDVGKVLSLEELRSNQIDPEQAVKDLLTPQRQKAYDDLWLWWKYHQPKTWYEAKPKVCRVDRYQQPDGEWITVAFTDGKLEKQEGGVTLIASSGYQIPLFKGFNLVDEGDQCIDIDGDGRPELVMSYITGHSDGEIPSHSVSNATGLQVLPISRNQVSLLHVVFDLRKFNADKTWRFRVDGSQPETKDVVIEQQLLGEWTERARFVWSVEHGKFEGPPGSKQEGFIAKSGYIEHDIVNQFMRQKPIDR